MVILNNQVSTHLFCWRKPTVIRFHCIRERADISMADICKTLQLAPKQSLWINSTADKLKNTVPISLNPEVLWKEKKNKPWWYRVICCAVSIKHYLIHLGLQNCKRLKLQTAYSLQATASVQIWEIIIYIYTNPKKCISVRKQINYFLPRLFKMDRMLLLTEKKKNMKSTLVFSLQSHCMTCTISQWSHAVYSIRGAHFQNPTRIWLELQNAQVQHQHHPNPRKLSFVCHVEVHLFGELGSLLTQGVFFSVEGSKGSPSLPLAWLLQIKSASRRSLAVASLSLEAAGAPSSLSHSRTAWQDFHVNYVQTWAVSKVTVCEIFTFS